MQPARSAISGHEDGETTLGKPLVMMSTWVRKRGVEGVTNMRKCQQLAGVTACCGWSFWDDLIQGNLFHSLAASPTAQTCLEGLDAGIDVTVGVGVGAGYKKAQSCVCVCVCVYVNACVCLFLHLYNNM